jgi:hypothetical protein
MTKRTTPNRHQGENALVILWNLQRERRPMSVTELADLMGEERQTIHRCIKITLLPAKAVVKCDGKAKGNGDLWQALDVPIREVALSLVGKSEGPRKLIRCRREEMWAAVGQRIGAKDWPPLLPPSRRRGRPSRLEHFGPMERRVSP